MNLTTSLVLIILIICLTVVICFCLQMNVFSVHRLFKLVSRLKIENNTFKKKNDALRKELNEAYNEWFENMSRNEKAIDAIYKQLYEITENLKKE